MSRDLSCPGCGLPFGAACSVTDVILGGTTYQRVALGTESADWWLGRPADEVCHDCSVRTGQHHHVGCDMEQCPRCAEQAVGCACLG